MACAKFAHRKIAYRRPRGISLLHGYVCDVISCQDGGTLWGCDRTGLAAINGACQCGRLVCRGGHGGRECFVNLVLPSIPLSAN